MQTYLVGGAVRDALLGRPGSDRDWVVIGATPEQIVDLRPALRPKALRINDLGQIDQASPNSLISIV